MRGDTTQEVLRPVRVKHRRSETLKQAVVATYGDCAEGSGTALATEQGRSRSHKHQIHPIALGARASSSPAPQAQASALPLSCVWFNRPSAIARSPRPSQGRTHALAYSAQQRHRRTAAASLGRARQALICCEAATKESPPTNAASMQRPVAGSGVKKSIRKLQTSAASPPDR
jgi:hypothetical protein